MTAVLPGDGRRRGAATQPFIVNGVPPTSVEPATKYQYIPSAANADGRTLSFVIANKPDWATFGETNGELAGIPEAAMSARRRKSRSSSPNGATQRHRRPVSHHGRSSGDIDHA